MRAELRVLLFSSVFVAGLAAVYWFTSYEDAGTTMLAVASAAYALLAGFVYLQACRRGVSRPSDVADPGEAGPEEIGYFPASSVWPPAMGLGAVLVALGLVFGYWFIVIAAIFVLGSIIGYAVEASVPR